MLASLAFVEKFISLPKVKKSLHVNGKVYERNIFDIEKIAPLLTRQGFEVDSVTVRGEELNSVVVGKIEKIEPHPNAEKLKVCYVNVGESSLRKIVCGASNARLNLYVAVALPGTKLPNGVEIKPAKVRDVESLGMLCSREELGLLVNTQTDGLGIWEIERDDQGGFDSDNLTQLIGTPVFDALQMYDVLLDLSVTPNRPDMLCHQGVARELAAGFAYSGIPFELRNPSLLKTILVSEENIKNDVIKNSRVSCGELLFHAENSLKYSAFFVLLDSISVKSSPAWLRNLIESLGQNSINNVVDCSNFILLAYGQPSHAFDLDKIAAIEKNTKKLILRYAKQEEKFLGLDGKERVLHETDSVVADCENVQALLGVVGGEFTKVTEKTSRIVIEFVNPNSVAIRRTSRRHARQTDASFLFEKGIDIQSRFKAAAELYALIHACSPKKPIYCGSVHSFDHDQKPVIQTQFNNLTLNFSASEQKKVLGSSIIDYEKQISILSSLGFELSKVNNELTQVKVPSWRSYDIADSADLVEEFIRVVGIDSVPSIPIVSESTVNKDDTHFNFIEKLNSKCAALGYSEVISLHFMRADDYSKLCLQSINSLGEPIVLLNPIIGDEPFMHTTLIPDLLRKVSRNLGYACRNGQIFHSCRTFQNADTSGLRVFQNNGENLGLRETLNKDIANTFEYHYSNGYIYTREKSQNGRPVETPRLAGVAFGLKSEKTWQNNAEIEWSLHDIIAHVHELCRSLGVTLNVNVISQVNDNNQTAGFHPMASALHPGRRVGFSLINNHNAILPLGWAGELCPQVKRNYEIDVPCFAFEINIAILIKVALENQGIVKQMNQTQKFQTVLRDFSFLLNEETTAQEVNDCVKNSIANFLVKEIPAKLTEVKIFDIYRGKGVAENKKSVTFKLALEPLERTLTDKEIQKIYAAVVDSVTKNLKAELRGC